MRKLLLPVTLVLLVTSGCASDPPALGLDRDYSSLTRSPRRLFDSALVGGQEVVIRLDREDPPEAIMRVGPSCEKGALARHCSGGLSEQTAAFVAGARATSLCTSRA